MQYHDRRSGADYSPSCLHASHETAWLLTCMQPRHCNFSKLWQHMRVQILLFRSIMVAFCCCRSVALLGQPDDLRVDAAIMEE